MSENAPWSVGHRPTGKLPTLHGAFAIAARGVFSRGLPRYLQLLAAYFDDELPGHDAHGVGFGVPPLEG